MNTPPGEPLFAPERWREVRRLLARLEALDDDGRAERFGPGDTFVIPAGYRGTWETVEPVRKLYVIYQP